MNSFIVLSALVAVALAKPSQYLLEPAHDLGYGASPYAYATPSLHVKLVPAAPIGYDGRVVDTPEVAHAKAEHHVAHIHEKATLAHEAAKSADVIAYAAAPALLATSYHTNSYASLPATASYHGALPVHHAVAPVSYVKLVPAAPLGYDGRVVDTPEVAHAKAEHIAAHEHEKITLAHEEAKSYSHHAAPNVQLVSAYSSGSYAPHHYHSVAPLVSVW